ncbi:MAG: dihydropteroate synthase [Pelagibacteraceae bacterium BACL20 MAG-120920-bin64]|jgi:dihydropteroate synthase|nr:MAG: dihydropteroate synthase [Pelagibacteraceae bacterium BACL20 MAG-120920-bin64]
MKKYYTRACNFTYGKLSIKLVNGKKNLPLKGNKEISFDEIEIISRNSKKIINIKDIKNLPKLLKIKVKKDLNIIIKKNKNFANLNFKKLPNLMGVLNLTPDSFSDGGRFNKKSKGITHAINLFKFGSNIIDVGGESTRPGSKTVSDYKEWKRIESTIKKISKKIPLSLDTRKSEIMKKGIKLGVKIINDVSGLEYDLKTVQVLKEYKIPFVIHHSQGTPENMQIKPSYKNVLLDIYDFFEEKIKFLRTKGVKHNNIIIDPGIGFGKNLKHNMNLIRDISIFHTLGFPVLVGVSKKRFIKELSGINDTKNRAGGTVASSLYLIMQGVQILRVHDVKELMQGIKVFKELKN